MKKKFFVHCSSLIDENVKIGDGSKIWHFSHISKNVKIGKNCTFGQNIFIGENVKIGNRVKVQNNVSIYSGVKIMDDVFIGPSVVFTNIKKPRSFINKKKSYENTLISKGATIGANSTIICGVKIGEYSLVGAGSVVTKNVPSKYLVLGNPSKIIKKIEKNLK